jgi:predicted TIM-barrel fold metal-dependent hydrolase
MDTDHIDADVMYPGIMRYTERIANAEVRLASCQVYNEWIADFCKFDPKRLAAVGVVPLLDDNNGENALACLKQARKLGLPSVSLSQKEPGMPLHHPAADKFWAAAAEMGMPISIHIYTNPFTRGMSPEVAALPGSQELGTSTITLSMAEHLVLLIFGGVFQRHPNLKIVLAEGGIGWIPALLERLDHVFHVHRPYMGSPITELPSVTFKKNCYATFQFDNAGVRLRDLVGVDNIMWASDYPHTDTTWPESKQTIDRIFAGVPAAEKHKMVAGNAARLYGFTR